MEGFILEDAASSMTWQGFEGMVSEILRMNGFTVEKNLRFMTGRRYEIDIVAGKNNVLLCIDCKHWKGGRSKRHGYMKAAKDQEARSEELQKFLGGNPATGKKFGVARKTVDVRPLIVTLLQEDIVKEGDTLIVPVWKLNSFLLEMEKYF